MERQAGSLDTNVTDRAYVYHPAPPAGTDKLDVQVGSRGTVKNVPIR
ncbi:hypothetical protein OG417_46225 [Actinoallomurus sp. NBC_01490]|nr:hypothetical protein [Actinoallomurus sp. NBC_01490]